MILTQIILSTDKIMEMWKRENFLSSLARSHIHWVFSMLVFCRYTVVYSAIPQVKGTAMIVYVFWCIYVSAWLYQIFFHFFFYSDPVSVCVVLYVIILIQIRIRYNVKNFITACTRLHDSDPQKWKISLPWEGEHPPPPARSLRFPRAWSLRSLAFVLNIIFFVRNQKSSPPPHF